jgi:fatty acid desaturase
VALVYVGTMAIVGISLSLVFQLAHCVEEAEFPLPNAESGRIDNGWAVHQVESTVNFARDNRLLCWLLGGLNFQIEHHLFPRICHVNYPALSRVGGADLPRLRRALPRAPLVPRRDRVALPLDAAHGQSDAGLGRRRSRQAAACLRAVSSRAISERSARGFSGLCSR